MLLTLVGLLSSHKNTLPNASDNHRSKKLVNQAYNPFLFVSGSQHSGAYEEDFNASSNDLDSSQQENHHENNEDDDEDGVDARCTVCERQCIDIDQ